jgi:hypothetical protein
LSIFNVFYEIHPYAFNFLSSVFADGTLLPPVVSFNHFFAPGFRCFYFLCFSILFRCWISPLVLWLRAGWILSCRKAMGPAFIWGKRGEIGKEGQDLYIISHPQKPALWLFLFKIVPSTAWKCLPSLFFLHSSSFILLLRCWWLGFCSLLVLLCC